MSDIDRETCRKAAAECVELARITNDPAKKEILLTHAQEWLKLAYSKSDAEFHAAIRMSAKGPVAVIGPQLGNVGLFKRAHCRINLPELGSMMYIQLVLWRRL